MGAQAREGAQLQKESAQRLQGFMDELRGGGPVDLSAKNLGEEGCAFVVEALAFNDRWALPSRGVVPPPRFPTAADAPHGTPRPRPWVLKIH